MGIASPERMTRTAASGQEIAFMTGVHRQTGRMKQAGQHFDGNYHHNVHAIVRSRYPGCTQSLKITREDARQRCFSNKNKKYLCDLVSKETLQSGRENSFAVTTKGQCDRRHTLGLRRHYVIGNENRRWFISD